LASEPSAALRDQLIAEINGLKDADDFALWAKRSLPAKNTLTTDDAVAVENPYRTVLDASSPDDLDDFSKPTSDLLRSMPADAKGGATNPLSAYVDEEKRAGQLVTPLRKPVRAGNKAHLIFVAAQPCLICQRSPCDAHHLK